MGKDIKKVWFVLGSIWSFNVYASNNCGADVNINCWDCGKTVEDDCTARLDGTKLIITSNNNGQMKDYNKSDDISPWGRNITSIDINGVSSVGNYAMWGMFVLTDVSISDSVQNIGRASFDYSYNLKNITLPSNLKTIDVAAFSTGGLETLVIPDSVISIDSLAFQDQHSLKTLVIGNGLASIKSNSFDRVPDDLVIYCEDTTQGRCHNLIQSQNQEVLDKLKLFTKDPETGILKTEDGQYFANSDLMAKGKTCGSEENCKVILSTIDAGKLFFANGKFYASLADWAQGKYAKKRIYTVEEAAKLSKPTGNTIKLRYK